MIKLIKTMKNLNKKQQQELQRRGIYGNYQYSLFPKPVGGGPFNRYPFYGQQFATKSPEGRPRPYNVKK